MSDSPHASAENAPSPRKRRIWIFAALAALAIAGAVVWWARHTGGMVTTFGTAMRARDAEALVRLASLPDRAAVLTEAKTIWTLCSAATDQTGPLPDGACQVQTLPCSLWDLLAGRRDLLVLAVHPQTAQGIDVFYYRIRAGHLKAGADPRKFDELEDLAQRLLAATASRPAPNEPGQR